MKSLEDLQKKIEEDFNVELKEVLGKSSGDFYVPVRKDNPKSTRLWLLFHYFEDTAYATVGDFSSDKQIKYKINFNISEYKKSTGKPNKEDYLKEREIFRKRATEIWEKGIKKHSSYLKKYKKVSPSIRTLCDSDVLIISFVSLRTGKIEGLQYIYQKGGEYKKYFLKNSEISGKVHIIKKPEGSQDLVYLAEGIKTAYAVALGCPTNSGVICTGSLGNMKPVIQILKEQNRYKHFVLCSEEGNDEEYIKLKSELNVLLVGISGYSDLADYYESTNLDCLKGALLNFKEKNYIPLGLHENKLRVYLKKNKIIANYRKNETELLYSDCLDTDEIPNRKQANELYFRIRALCRKVGNVSEQRHLYLGIYPLKENFLYYNQAHTYFLKEKKLIKVREEDLLTRNLLLCREQGIETIDLLKLKPLTVKELEYIFSICNLFTFSHKVDNKLIMGWVIQSLLTGGVDYRTPIWISAQSFSGKSQVSKRFIFNCFPYFEIKEGRTTTSRWLPRKFDGRAIPLHRDEFEPSIQKQEQAKEELEFVRNTATERFPSRGISAGISNKTLSFFYCFSSLFSSIKKPKELESADLGRFIFFDLKYIYIENYENQILQFEKFMDFKNQNRFLLNSLFKLEEINKSYQRYMANSEFKNIRSHKKSSVSMLASCFNAIFPDKALTDKEVLNTIILKTQTAKKDSYSKILEDCLFLVIDKHKFDTLNSIQLLEAIISDDTEIHDFLNHRGIYIYDNTLLINPKKGIYFLTLLFKYAGSPTNKESLYAELSTDGDYLLSKNYSIGVLKHQVIPRGEYLKFNLQKIKKELL